MTYIDTFNLSTQDNIEVFEAILGENYGVFKEIHHEISKIDDSIIIDIIGHKCDNNLRIDVIFNSEANAIDVMKHLVLTSENIIISINDTTISFVSF